ncbi:hypothetical protein CROQUDRAFT_673540 [Cronartium quercuum f. sp. fusiforme G11]|uniref:Uncharacterized protein n=1 Tax=Cronartium quercuum f. sp. fusiforme G11 TaxID=708437 RepID=A0A9P6NEA6_9BASI|nr:hypothetical protein CROQUDRAFT_673540 [Cronartium quercuum f. sp. fusiforme G11]
MTHSIHHTHQLSSSAGIGKSPINLITYSSNHQPTSSILNTLCRVHSHTQIQTCSHATQPDTDQCPITIFRFPLPPSHPYSSASLPEPSLPLTQPQQQHDKRPECNETGAHLFVASLGQAPISSAIPTSAHKLLLAQVQPPSQQSFYTESESWLNSSNPHRPTHSISSAPTLLPLTRLASTSHLVNLPHSRPKLVSSTSPSNSFQIHLTSEHIPPGTVSNIQPSLHPPKHARFQQSPDGVVRVDGHRNNIINYYI